MASRLMLAFEAVLSKLMTDDGRKLEGSGTDRSKVAHFCKRLELLLVAKQSARSHPFMQARLTLERTSHALADIQAVAKPDKEVIWLETAQEEIECDQSK